MIHVEWDTSTFGWWW